MVIRNSKDWKMVSYFRIRMHWHSQPGRIYVKSFRPTRNSPEAKKPIADFHFFHCYHFLGLEHEAVKKARWKAWQNPLDGMTSRKCGLAAEYCSKWQRQCQNLGFFEDQFHYENLHFRDWNSANSCCNLLREFYLRWQKNTCFRVTFSWIVTVPAQQRG